MSTQTIEKDFQDKVCETIRISQEGMDRYRVFTPFMFEDGDHLPVVLRREAGQWVLTDEGHTYMHLTYDLDERQLQGGTRAKIIDNALDAFSINDRGGELILPIADEGYGDALYSFVQALLKVTDVTFLTRERVRSTFMEDLQTFLCETIPEERMQFDWTDPQHDPEGKYQVDCHINGMSFPLILFGLHNDSKVRDATITPAV